MEFITKTYQTENGSVEGVCVKWEGFSILMVCGPKGFLACPAIDAVKCDGYGKPCALVESSAENPIGTLERFCERKLTVVNQEGQELGLKEGMIAKDAFKFLV